jgi:DNA-binding phage protein
MTSSARQDFLSDVLSKEPIPPGKLAYFQARLAIMVHQAMLKIFDGLEPQKNFMRRDLADRIGRKPQHIARWLSYPGNPTLSTVSDIFVGMGYEVESITLKNLATGVRLRCPSHSVD